MKEMLPVITAVLGLLGGLLIALIRERFSDTRNKENIAKDKENKRQQLAKEILDIEFQRAKFVGKESPYSTIAHFVVLNELIDKSTNFNIDLSLREITESINKEYQERCWPSGYNEGAQDVVHSAIADPDKIRSTEFLINLKTLLESESIINA